MNVMPPTRQERSPPPPASVSYEVSGNTTTLLRHPDDLHCLFLTVSDITCPVFVSDTVLILTCPSCLSLHQICFSSSFFSSAHEKQDATKRSLDFSLCVCARACAHARARVCVCVRAQCFYLLNLK